MVATATNAMVTTSSIFLNAFYVTLGIWLLTRQLRILNRLHAIVKVRQREESSGIWPTLRMAPYSAMVSTMLFAFGALIQVALYSLMPILVATGDGGMSPSLLFLVHVRNMCFIGGAFASASHKAFIYTINGENRRGRPPSSGKANGSGRVAEPWSLPSTTRRPIHDKTVHHFDSKDLA